MRGRPSGDPGAGRVAGGAAGYDRAMVRTVGVEEELVLLDRSTRAVVAAAPRVLKAFREHGPDAEGPDQELFRHQLETRTEPFVDLADLLDQLVATRRTAGEASAAAGLALGACGIPPLGGDEASVSPGDRYRDMVDTFGEVARTGGTCGMHVHVAITSAEEGVAVLDRIAPWLPVLLALSANSPFARGRDTGYASWRAQVWSRWPSAGPTEPFGSLTGYRDACRTLLETGAARDEGMLYFDARLATAHPTVEVRVCDVCTEPGAAVAIAALVRGLVETAARDAADGRPVPPWRAEALRAAHWRAARYGVADRLLDPVHRELRPAGEVLDRLVASLAPVLAGAGDLDRVGNALERAVAGNGANRQRAAFERSGSVAGVVDDLISRTEASWRAGDLP